jgi:alkaline phosphatase
MRLPIVCAGLLLLLAHMSAAAQAKNVILMIADGWSDNNVVATDDWQGAQQCYERFPVHVFMSTYSWSTVQADATGTGYDPRRAWRDFKYPLIRPTDSAAAATALSTGVKTYDGGLNIDPVTLAPLVTVCELAEREGRSTGVITTVPFCHATPAGFIAHDLKRGNYAQIAAEMIDSSDVDVVMGAGHPFFDGNGQPVTAPRFDDVGGEKMWKRLVAGTAGGAVPFTLIETRAEFQALASGATPPRICGIAPAYSTANQERLPAESANEPQPPYSVPRNATVPTLAEMTRGALNVLDNNPRGFFLMIEGGAVDWANHDNQQGRMIEEMIDFGEAVQAVLDWVAANSSWEETLLIVTGDHECGYLWGPDAGGKNFSPLVDHGKGNVPGMKYYSGNHSNELIPLYASGAGSAELGHRATNHDPVRGAYLDNTDVGKLMKEQFGAVAATSGNERK